MNTDYCSVCACLHPGFSSRSAKITGLRLFASIMGKKSLRNLMNRLGISSRGSAQRSEPNIEANTNPKTKDIQIPMLENLLRK